MILRSKGALLAYDGIPVGHNRALSPPPRNSRAVNVLDQMLGTRNMCVLLLLSPALLGQGNISSNFAFLD